MSVDKFGRQSGSSQPKGEGFVLTKEGNYDIGHKRLQNVKASVEADDAVNLKQLKKTIDICLQMVDVRCPSVTTHNWSFGNRRLSEVTDPVNLNDVVTLNYLIHVLGNILYAMYQRVAPPGDELKNLNKDDWIRVWLKVLFI